MLSTIIYYVIVGVAFNFFWDLIISNTEAEQYRFTMVERVIVTLIWPVAVGFFLFTLIKNLFSDNSQD